MDLPSYIAWWFSIDFCTFTGWFFRCKLIIPNHGSSLGWSGRKNWSWNPTKQRVHFRWNASASGVHLCQKMSPCYALMIRDQGSLDWILIAKLQSKLKKLVVHINNNHNLVMFDCSIQNRSTYIPKTIISTIGGIIADMIRNGWEPITIHVLRLS